MTKTLVDHLELVASKLSEPADLGAREREILSYLLEIEMTRDEINAHHDDLGESDEKSLAGDLIRYLADSDRPYIWSSSCEFTLEYRVISNCSFDGIEYHEGEVVTLDDLDGPRVEIDTAVFFEDDGAARFEAGLMIDGDTEEDMEWRSTLDGASFTWEEPILGKPTLIQVETA